MEQNLFESLQQRRQQLLAFAEKAASFGWIPREKTDKANSLILSLQEIKEKLEQDVLTIGVIGQMKCGKSTFLNAFVFQDEVLPAATTPMTAALSVITYGPQKKVVADFYTEDEWAEQVQQSKRSLDDLEGAEKSKVQAAKELVEKSYKLGNQLNSLLGKQQEDTLERLEEYVGADGKYISMTKAVKIYYPKDYLKGVEIVDTPGFNDPIVSREERTKSFLRKADVVLMMLYAGRPFDATDRDIIFKYVGQAGTGKVLVGINKYDIPYGNGETEDEIKAYVEKEIRQACKEDDRDNTSISHLLKHLNPIPLSAEMALLSQLPMTRITNNEDWQHAWNRHCDTFGIGSQQQFAELSKLDVLSGAIQEVIEKEKQEILFAKPTNALNAAGEKILDDIKSKILTLRETLSILKTPDTELEEKLSQLNKLERKCTKKVDGLKLNIELEEQQRWRKSYEELVDTVISKKKELLRIVDQMSTKWIGKVGVDKTASELNRKFEDLQYEIAKVVRRQKEDLHQKIVNEAEYCIDSLFRALRQFFDDSDSAKVLGNIKKVWSFDPVSIDQIEIDFKDYISKSNFGDYVNVFVKTHIGGFLTLDFNRKETKSHFEDMVNRIPKVYEKEGIYEYYHDVIRDGILERIPETEKILFEELISPLKEALQKVLDDKSNRESQLKDTKAELEKAKEQKLLIEQQKEEMKQFHA